MFHIFVTLITTINMYENLTEEELGQLAARVKKELEIVQKLKIKSLEEQIDLYLDDLIALNKELEKRKKSDKGLFLGT